MDKVKLKVFGITYSQIQNGAYALVLSEEDGPFRIPIVVGTAEAQSIAIKLEGIIPQRPMTHDLFVSFSHAFGVSLDEVFIYKFKDGVFYSELKFSSADRQISIDARTSDAISLALRTDAPIYTTQEIIDTTGFIFDEQKSNKGLKEGNGNNHKPEIRLDQYAVSELEKMMQKCAENEDYERAAEIKAIINNKQGNKNKSN